MAQANTLSTLSESRDFNNQSQQAITTENKPANSTPAKKNRASVRLSSYSVAPSMAPTFRTDNSAHAEIHDIQSGLQRMENKALTSQRVMLSEEKQGNMSKLALGAKLERALDRRMSSQDAEFRPRRKTIGEGVGEKTG